MARLRYLFQWIWVEKLNIYKMKILEALANEISRQKKIDALMKLKQQKEAELKEIRTALRLVIHKR